MPALFISYRRSDSQDVAGRIYERLAGYFEARKVNVVRDVDSFPVGEDFRKVLRNKIRDCEVVLVIIGPTWASVKDSKGNRRLDDAADTVRIEVEQALEMQKKVIPICVTHSVMPPAEDLPATIQELAFRNGVQVRPDPDFQTDISRLIAALDTIFQGVPSVLPPRLPPRVAPARPVPAKAEVVPHPAPSPPSSVASPLPPPSIHPAAPAAKSASRTGLATYSTGIAIFLAGLVTMSLCGGIWLYLMSSRASSSSSPTNAAKQETPPANPTGSSKTTGQMSPPPSASSPTRTAGQKSPPNSVSGLSGSAKATPQKIQPSGVPGSTSSAKQKPPTSSASDRSNDPLAKHINDLLKTLDESKAREAKKKAEDAKKNKSKN